MFRPRHCGVFDPRVRDHLTLSAVDAGIRSDVSQEPVGQKCERRVASVE
ncbi:MAG: hypothetical protein GY772_32870 [bacterium]|nr:hypothetical protein [bacterium]